jgi:hypothetical protein
MKNWPQNGPYLAWIIQKSLGRGTTEDAETTELLLSDVVTTSHKEMFTFKLTEVK